MRVIKNNTRIYKAFHQTLPSITKSGTSSAAAVLNNNSQEGTEYFYTKDYNTIIKILEFGKNIKILNNITEAEENFRLLLNDLFSCKETNILQFNEEKTALKSILQPVSSRAKYFINSLAAAGTLNEILKTGKHKIIRDSLVYDIDGTKSFYLIIPFSGDGKCSGILSVLMPFSLNENSIEIPLIKISLEMFLNKLEAIEKQEELKSAYNQLQVYQSKLSNDYKLSAIGELTGGIMEDVLSPLQVITTSTELLKHENSPADDKVLDTINFQVQKVKSVVNRLVKFAGTVDVKNKVYPCNINNIIVEFYRMFSSSLKNENYECVLDLGNNIPSLLTHPNYINQVLMNIFSLLKAGGKKAGGIFIQTKCIKNNVEVKFLSTDYFEYLNGNILNPEQDVNVKIINNLMIRHQGKTKFDSNKNRGTIIILSFPLIRKVEG